MKRFASERVASMMERLGLDEDNYIESGIVGKTVESAQSRVEGFNFDIRKRVVEFDDVINLQRETIYEERDKVLRNEDLTETIRHFLDEDIDELVESKLGAEHGAPGEGVAELMVELGRMGIGPDRVTADHLLDLGSNAAISEHLKAIADEMLEQKEQEIGAEAWASVERFVLLRTIDALWVEHLTELDDMRRGIGLRGYSQQDPLNEFRKEAFGLYEELSGFIRHQVANSIFRVTVTQQPAPPVGVFPMAGPGQPLQAGGGSSGTAGMARLTPTAGTAVTGGSRNGGPGQGIRRTAGVLAGGAGAGGALGGTQQARPGYTPTGEKIGRNDACWCGSGLKYKKCHGR